MKIRCSRKGVTTIEAAIVVLLVIAIATSGTAIYYVTTLQESISSLSESVSSDMASVSKDVRDILEIVGAPPPPTPTPTPKPRVFKVAAMAAGADALIWTVARDKGFLKKYGIENQVRTVFVERDLEAYAYGAVDIGAFSALEIAGLINEGWDVVIFGNLLLSTNRIFVLKDSPHQTLEDLKGKKFGQYGWGSAGTQMLWLIAKLKYGIDVEKDYEHVVASSAVLQELLDTGQVDFITQFLTRSISMLAHPEKYRVIFGPYTAEWEEMYGVPLPQCLLTTHRELYEEYPDFFEKLEKATTEAQLYVRDHAEDILKEYGESLLGVTWEEAKVIIDDLAKNQYDPAWDESVINAQWLLLETAASLKVRIDKVPEAGKEAIFVIPGS